MTKPTIAIIGAGISGLILANLLQGKADITLFEKARGVSGRATTRYADAHEFDHGAQYFTARSAEFQTFLAPLIADGIIAEWTPRVTTLSPGKAPYKRDWFEPHYVASPRMNSLSKQLADGLTIRLDTRIDSIEKNPDGWQLTDHRGETHVGFTHLLLTCPAPQTAALLPDSFNERSAIESVKMQGCFSVMIGFNEVPLLLWDAAKVMDSPIGWLAWNQSKPARPPAPALLLQSTNDWAEAHIDEETGEVQHALLQALAELIELPVQQVSHLTTHRWRYAACAEPLAQDFLYDEALQLGVCGDWCIGSKIEAAFLSAYRLANQLSDIFG